MIAGQTFENFREMYQQAVKIARVLEESYGPLLLALYQNYYLTSPHLNP